MIPSKEAMNKFGDRFRLEGEMYGGMRDKLGCGDGGMKQWKGDESGEDEKISYHENAQEGCTPVPEGWVVGWTVEVKGMVVGGLKIVAG